MAASLTIETPAFVIVSDPTAVTLTGTFWTSAGSFCAVTVTGGICTGPTGALRLRLKAGRPTQGDHDPRDLLQLDSPGHSRLVSVTGKVKSLLSSSDVVRRQHVLITNEQPLTADNRMSPRRKPLVGNLKTSHFTIPRGADLGEADDVVLAEHV